ncbi:hypothetical protein BD311DRAFT_808819 [Dichomitus squalens]|uniref:Uncharacterized protein n=1 Tax=Dichomitus squalens TaxID=114155 RepID=A0A4Q9MEU2_9APHY|nr:hypothetical protein BD311DRAFT_808819 [Dichomitus squalens]
MPTFTQAALLRVALALAVTVFATAVTNMDSVASASAMPEVPKAAYLDSD